ncbi:TonB-dependent receptor [Gloeobacter violaceus]|nr:TonB-dependent receptor [Gloeobacter violaceus]
MESRFVSALVLLAGSFTVGWTSAVSAEVPPPVLARASAPEPIRAQDLLREHTGRQAIDLKAVPSAWDWTQPVIEPQVGQAPPAAPTPAPAATAEEPATAQQTDEGDFLDEVAVTATRRPTRARDSTQSVNVIKREDFQAQGAVTVSDALLLIPGFNNSTPALGGQSNLSANFLRGFGDTQYVVLRDGVRLGSPFNGRSDVSALVLDDLERIEVITGGSTLRYGSGSVGGVINLITETPKGPPKLSLSYQYGSYSFNRFVGKYSGGDDTFSYNLIFTGIAAGNNYPFGFTLPTSPQFYGPNDVVTGSSCVGPLGRACGDGSLPNGTNLYGFLKPEVGPPTKVQGINDLSHVGNDNYMGKFTFKPDTDNKLTLRLNQHNLSIGDRSPGYFDYNICGFFTGPTTTSNGTYFNNDFGVAARFLPLNAQGQEVRCPVQTYLPVTPSSTLAFPFNYSRNYAGNLSVPTGTAFPQAERAQGDDSFFRQRSLSETEASLTWDWDISPSQSVNSYLAYYKQSLNFFRPNLYYYNTDVLGGQAANGPTASGVGELQVGPVFRPYIEGQRFEVQSTYNVQLSPGQILSVGANFVQDRIYVQTNTDRDDFNVLTVSYQDVATSRTSIFIVDDISFSDLLKTNFGVRYTYSDQFGQILTPAAGVRVNLANNLSLRGNYSQVFNAPSLNNLYISTGTYGQNTGIPNPNLKPETGITFDVGVDYSPLRNLFVKLTYFSTYVDNTFQRRIFLNPNFTPGSTTESIIIDQTINLGSRRGNGIEFSADWRFADQWQLRAIWTNVDARPYGNYSDDIDSFTYPNFKEYQDYNIPYNSAIGALTYANKGLTATLLARYDDGKYRFRGDNSTRVPSWFTLDLNVEIPITPLFTLTGSVFNLTDTQYEYLDANPAPGTTFRIGGRFDIGG